MPLHDSPCTWPQEGCVCRFESLNFTPMEQRYNRYATQHRFIQSVTRLKAAFQDVNAYWDNLDKEDQEILINKYPFDDMFETMIDAIIAWQDAMIEGWKL